MRPLVITQNITVDGSVEMLDGWFDPQWQNSTIIGHDPVAGVRELMEGPGGGEIVVTGSITLCHALVRAGLVTGYRLWTYPYVQGRGRRLFPEGYSAPLRLVEHLSFTSGVTYTHWTTKEQT